MQNKHIVLSLLTGLILTSGLTTAAQASPAAPPSAASKTPSAASASFVSHLVELRLLSPDGKQIGRVTVTSLEGPLRVRANHITITPLSDQNAQTIRLQGHIFLSTKRSGAEVTLLEMNAADAMVEYTAPVSGPERTNKAVYAPNFGPASRFLNPAKPAEPALSQTVLPFDRASR